jgi:hypothetical protein
MKEILQNVLQLPDIKKDTTSEFPNFREIIPI